MGNEIDVKKPSVAVEGVPVDDLFCLRITKKTGSITPSTCDLQYFPVETENDDIVGPITLSGSYNGTRRPIVTVYDEYPERVWFQGFLDKRMDQHAQNCVIWQANDMMVLLRHIFVKGIFVLDTLLDKSHVLKYVAATDTIFNPKGAWNCTGYEVGGVTYPVFSPTAIYGQAYIAPNYDNPIWEADPVVGEVQPWTPRRILRYLQFALHSKDINGGIVPGETLYGENSLSKEKIELSVDQITGMKGLDPAFHGISTNDPLDHVSPELTLQGDSFAGAFEKVLKITGTHQLVIRYHSDFTAPTPETPSIAKALLKFLPTGYVPVTGWTNIGIQFSGLADQQKGTMFDFSLSEDSTNLIDHVYLEGEVEKTETELYYNADENDGTIVPAWTPNQQKGFLACISGSFNGSVSKYALVPKVFGKDSINIADYYQCDGNNGTSVIRVFSKEAIAIAQQSFPLVFRAFQTKTQLELEGALGENCLVHPRPILPQQLQFITYKSEDVGDVRLRSHLPIRIRIEVENKYYDIPRDTAVRVTTDFQGNNLIWFDGIGVAADATVECIYSGSIQNFYDISNNRIKLRSMKVNCALNNDTRTIGYKGVVNNISTSFSSCFTSNSVYGYIDTPNSFRSHWQYNSSPASNQKYYGGTNGTTEISVPITREVPPGVEVIHANYAADRELMRRFKPIRNSSFIQAGILGNIDAGDWLGNIVIHRGETTTNYEINAGINKVEWDYLKQTTTIGDVVGEY